MPQQPGAQARRVPDVLHGDAGGAALELELEERLGAAAVDDLDPGVGGGPARAEVLGLGGWSSGPPTLGSAPAAGWGTGGRVAGSRTGGEGFEPPQLHCTVRRYDATTVACTWWRASARVPPRVCERGPA